MTTKSSRLIIQKFAVKEAISFPQKYTILCVYNMYLGKIYTYIYKLNNCTTEFLNYRKKTVFNKIEN